MAERAIDQLTLREMFSDAEGVVRDLSEHLHHNFHHKMRIVGGLVRSYKIPDERNSIADTAVRTEVAALLASDDYSQTLFQKLDRYLKAIEERSQSAIGGQ